MLVAVATIVGHTTLPHHHHELIEALAHHNDHHEDESTDTDHHDHEQNKKDDHNIFSFAQLDEDFVPSQFSKVSLDLPILYLLTPVLTYRFKQLNENSKNHFVCYREFPPPGSYSSNLFSRPPPVEC